MADRSSAVLQWPAAFMKWWTDELAGMLPSSSRSSALKGRSCLILVLDDAEIAVLRTEAEESLALRQRLDMVSDEADFLASIGDERAAMTELFAELPPLLPDHSHLRQLRISDKTIELNGLTEEPSELVTILDRSPLITSPTFSSPVIRDRQSGRDPFQISASLSGGSR